MVVLKSAKMSFPHKYGKQIQVGPAAPSGESFRQTDDTEVQTTALHEEVTEIHQSCL